MRRAVALTTLIHRHVREFNDLLKEYKKDCPRPKARTLARKEITRKYAAEFQTLCQAPEI